MEVRGGYGRRWRRKQNNGLVRKYTRDDGLRGFSSLNTPATLSRALLLLPSYCGKVAFDSTPI